MCNTFVPLYIHLLQYPNVFKTFLMPKRKYLSPIFLHTSLGCSASANPFIEYRSLTGQRIEEIYLNQTIAGIIHHYVAIVSGCSKTTLIYVVTSSSMMPLPTFIRTGDSYLKKRASLKYTVNKPQITSLFKKEFEYLNYKKCAC